MEKPITAALVAKYFIFKSHKAGKPISNKKLQKLVYYAQAWHLVLRDGKPLFNDPIEAWVHGPAVRALYGAYKQYGHGNIGDAVQEKDLTGITKDMEDVLDQVWEAYGEKYDAEYLEMLSHSEAPWQKAREGIEEAESSSSEISLDEMKKYYSSLK